MFKKVLVANRGEIAVRIIRACRTLGIKTVAVYSDPDAPAMHVRLADESLRIGPADPLRSYLDIDTVISAALKSGSEGIHPGYGFLAENSEFAAACEKEGIKFIGPNSKTLKITGDKSEAKRLVRMSGVPVVPGTDDPIDDLEEAKRAAHSLGFPVLLKSVYGGGGRGIREVANEDDLAQGFERAVSEAKGAFGRARVYLERLIKPARHVEVQLLADSRGKTVHLGERDCSIQRRHQKLVEFAPGPGISEDARERLCGYAVRVARAVGYENAGTVEFLLDGEGNFHFMEVNSRLQVEHPVTEMVTGVDIAAEQMEIASAGSLSLSQNEIEMSGAAIECRINAEDPSADFTPSAGTVQQLRLPGGPGVRVDTALYEGYTVPEYYDSLIAKLIVRGQEFEDARRRMVAALSELSVSGVQTTAPFHSALLQSEPFADRDFSTDFLERSGVLEQLRTRLEQGEQELGVAIGAAILARGLHKKLEFEEGGRSGDRWMAMPSRGGGRFFDQA